MGYNKILIILLIIWFLYIIFIGNFKPFWRNMDTFGSIQPSYTKNVESITYIKTDTLNEIDRIDLKKSTINLDPYSKDNNINIGNDLIVNTSFKIEGYDIPIDIPYLRYIKSLPYHFENELCLIDKQDPNIKNSGSTDCITKKHIEIVKGNRKINLKTYPKNYSKCLGSVKLKIKPNLNSPTIEHNIFTSNDCENGTHKNDFVIVRDPHIHTGEEPKEIHNHRHLIDVEEHIINDLINIEHD